MKKIVGIDIGGTMIKYGLLSIKGDILENGEVETEASKGIEVLFEKLCNIVSKYLKSNDILGIAVSGTGQIDGSIGKVIGGNPIIPGWIGTNLVEKLEKEFNLPAVLENDVNCAALGEKWLGAGKGQDNFICVTIGTGIGGGIVLNGEIFRGSSCVAGEFGHIQIEKNGKECLCGKKGCYERYASATALVSLAKEKTGKIYNGKQIFDKERKNEPIFVEVIKEWVDYFTDGLSTITYIFNPTLIIIGGGVTKQGDYLLNKFKDSLDSKLGVNYKKNLEIKFAELGNNAGMLGAEYLLLKKVGIL
ncbi:MAG: ROK family protein [Fusobacterium perfoetens]|uniref:ROK family protein n=1 Tax=Fusobacterium perfoetens TaxID=852 RepID=UPI0023EFC0D4|nr:ROK family protein [Fusobacterium perfoetens]MCI6151957.1 ROK family protein [Fusobacterium perfoetens]MDY3237870.1 ROK family protein [Fusobacterium perfoetens]